MRLRNLTLALCVLLVGCIHLRDDEQTSASLDGMAMVGFDEFETPTTHDMDAILDRVGRIEGVGKTQTHIALSVKFERP